VFTEGINAWWPKEHHIGASPSKEELIEPWVGVRWYSLDSSLRSQPININKSITYRLPVAVYCLTH
jgi:hypothetical protein